MKIFGWLGTIAGLMTFLLIRDEMAALLFWIGLGMLIHGYSRWKDLPLWELFLTATRPFRLSFVLFFPGALVFWTARTAQSWSIRNLFEPLGVLLLLLAIASALAGARAWIAQREPPTS